MDPVPPPAADTPVSAHADDLAGRFEAAWHELACPPGWRRLLVAVSGGPDSLALLHLLHQTRACHGLDLIVAHVDHGIHPASGEVASLVVAAADRLGLPTVLARLRLGGETSETSARAARHAWLEEARRTHGADGIALAHHEGDQVETIVMRALAGSGPAGLAGMSRRRDRLVRPLLGFRKAELVGWLASRGISGWADPANSDVVHQRSWVRADLLPFLRARQPGLDTRLLTLGRQAAEQRRAWDEALSVIPGLDLQPSVERISVAALPLVTYDSALAGTLLQAAARRVGCVLGSRRAAGLLAVARRGRSGARVELGGGWCGELSFGRIGIYRVPSPPAPLALRGPLGEARWGPWRVTWSRGAAADSARRDGWTGWFIGEGAVIRAPAPGDRVAPLGGTGRRPVVRVLQDARVERSRRAGWPVLEVDGRVVWVAGISRSGEAVPGEGDDALRIEVSGG